MKNLIIVYRNKGNHWFIFIILLAKKILTERNKKYHLNKTQQQKYKLNKTQLYLSNNKVIIFMIYSLFRQETFLN